MWGSREAEETAMLGEQELTAASGLTKEVVRRIAAASGTETSAFFTFDGL